MTKRRRQANVSSKDEKRSVPVVPYVPEGTEIIFADGAYVTYSQGTFILSFVQTEHPLAITEEEKARIKEVRSRCIARIAVAPLRVPAIIQVLQQTFGKALEQVEAEEAEGVEKEKEGES